MRDTALLFEVSFGKLCVRSYKMHFACKCLNVSIKSKYVRLEVITHRSPDVRLISDVEITPEELDDAFFRLPNLGYMLEWGKVTTEQPGLVEIKTVGSYFVYRCYNCSIYTHAVHKFHSHGLTVINGELVTSPEEIDKLKSSPNYSSVFRIIINHTTLDELDYLHPTEFCELKLPGTVQVALEDLQKQLEEAVQQQAAEIEDKIRAFTAEQYQLLEQYRERARNEHRLLTRLIYKEEESNRVRNNVETPRATSDSFTTTSATSTMNTMSQVISSDKKIINGPNVKHEASPRYSPNLLNGSIDKKDLVNRYTREPTSFDTEALFPLEGMEDTPAIDDTQSSDEGSDTDDSGHNEGMHIPRGQRGGHPTLAKSLPVSVPSFRSLGYRIIVNQDDDQLSRDPRDPHNIRASIKALAKSVHGDTVFGDLPRPRFSTQI